MKMKMKMKIKMMVGTSVQPPTLHSGGQSCISQTRSLPGGIFKPKKDTYTWKLTLCRAEIERRMWWKSLFSYCSQDFTFYCSQVLTFYCFQVFTCCCFQVFTFYCFSPTCCCCQVFTLPAALAFETWFKLAVLLLILKYIWNTQFIYLPDEGVQY